MNFKRSVLISLIAFMFVAAFAATASAQVWVYARRDAVGTSQRFGPGTYRADRNELGSLRNDSASSVRVERDFRIVLCESEGSGQGSGKCEEWGEGIHNLRYQNSASYIRVWRMNEAPPVVERGNGVVVFEGRDFRGRSQFFGPGIYRADRNELGNIGNDKASSVVVAPGFRVRICENEGNDGRGGGECENYASGNFNLRYNNKASFFLVKRTDRSENWWRDEFAVILYRGQNQTGVEQGFEAGTFRADRGQFGRIGNDRASSISIQQGFRAKICENEGRGDGGGKCEEYSSGSHNLRFDNRASFLRVWAVNR